MRAATRGIPQAFPLLVLLLLAASCGGGGDSSSQTPAAGRPSGSVPPSVDPDGPVQGYAVFGGPEFTKSVLERLSGGNSLPVFLSSASRDAASFEGLDLSAREVVGVAPASTARGDSPFGLAFAEAYGAEPAMDARRAYDAVYLGVVAALAAGSTDASAVAANIAFVANPPGAAVAAGPEALAAATAALETGGDVDLQGASGLLDLGTDGAPSKSAAEVWKLVNGSPVPIETRDVDLVAEVGAGQPAAERSPGSEPAPPLVVGLLAGPADGGGVAEAAQLAVDEINAAGGVFGQQVELLAQDPGDDPAAAALTLAEGGASFIVGPADAQAADGAAAAAREAGVPLITLAAVAGGDGGVFSLAPAETPQTAVLANLAIERGALVVCVLSETTVRGAMLVEAFTQAMAFKGAYTRLAGSPDDPAACSR